MFQAGPAAQMVVNSGLPAVGSGNRLLDKVFRVLSELKQLDCSGSVFLCAEAALKPSEILFVGLNPGGSEDTADENRNIRESLSCTRLGVNAFDQDWSSEKRTYEPGLAPMQKRFKFITQELGIAYGSVPALNLVFANSRSVFDLPEFDLLRDVTAPVHRLVVDTIRPNILWLMGNPKHAGSLLQIEPMDWRRSSYKNWAIGRGVGKFAGRAMEICHTPHLSFWNPETNLDELNFVFEKIINRKK